MANILCIETATENCSVALSVDDTLIFCKEAAEPKIHATQLNHFIEIVLKEAGKIFSDIDAVAVSKGPGSYTGLRIGVATAKGICYALNKPLIAVNTLQAMAYSFIESGLVTQENSNPFFIIPMIDARRDEVYCAVFDSEMQLSEQTEAKILDAFSFINFESRKVYFIGNGADKAEKILKVNSNFSFKPELTASAKGLVKPAIQLYNASQFESVAYFEPYYLKEFIAKLPQRQR